MIVADVRVKVNSSVYVAEADFVLTSCSPQKPLSKRLLFVGFFA